MRLARPVPIVIDEHSTIFSGHGRQQAAKLLRLQEVPVIVMAGLSDAEKRAYALADNKIAANAGWDRKALAVEIAELAALSPKSTWTFQSQALSPSRSTL